jgi:hypothetical protein
MDIRKLLYDILVIFVIAISILPVSVWASIVAAYYTITSLPGQLLHLAERIYDENLQDDL